MNSSRKHGLVVAKRLIRGATTALSFGVFSSALPKRGSVLFQVDIVELLWLTAGTAEGCLT